MSDLKSQTACFTGHRELYHNPTEIYQATKAIVQSLIDKGYCFFYVGGARGYDALAAQVVLELKTVYPQIALTLILPFQNQYEHEAAWSEEEIAEYHDLQAKASNVIILSEHYSRGIYFQRNRRLVDASSVCIAYLVKPTGGTAYTVKYASKQGLQVVNCMPK